jgi:hypothetical protein
MICGKNDIQKLLTKPLKVVTDKDKPPKTGNLVKKYIKKNKEVLGELKKEAKEKNDHE